MQPEAAKVVVSDAGIEIHGYVVARAGNHIRLVWAVASGRLRQRTVAAEAVVQPRNGHRWDGYLITDEQLSVIRQAAR